MNDILFGNTNRPVIKKLAGRYFKSSKSRNVIAVIAIILTSILFTTIFTLGSGLLDTIQDQNIRKAGGDGHAALSYISDDIFDEIKDNELIDRISYTKCVSYRLHNAGLEKWRAEMWYMDDTALEFGRYEPTTGRTLEAENEIMVDTETLKALGVPAELGATVPLEYEIKGETYTTDFVLCGFWETDSLSNIGRLIVSKAFIDVNSDLLAYTYPVDNDYSGVVVAYIMFKGNGAIEPKLNQLLSEAGYTCDTMGGIRGDENYINAGVNPAYQGSSLLENPFMLVSGIVGVLLIMMTGYLIIYNIFQISVIQDIQSYGQLKTLGTTRRQIKKLISKQVIRLSCIGIPIGLLIGFFIGRSLVPFLMNGTAYTAAAGIKVSVNPLIFIGSAIFAWITVYISVRKPAKIAGTVSPVEAIRYTENDTSAFKGKKAITKKSTHGAQIYRMALANLGRNKKRTILVIVSMTLSLVLFNTVFTLSSGFDIDKYVSKFLNKDFIISSADYFQYRFDRSDAELSQTFIHAVQQEDAYADGGELSTVRVLEEFFSVESETIVNHNKDKAGNPHVSLYGADDFLLKSMEVIEGEIDWEALHSGKYVLYGLQSDDNGNIIQDQSVQVGDVLRFHHSTADGLNSTMDATVDLTVMAKVRINNSVDTHRQTGGTNFYMPTDNFKPLCTDPHVVNFSFNVKPGQEMAMEDFLTSYTENIEPGMDYESKQTYVNSFHDLTSMIITIGGALSVIIGLIGITNFINSMLTSIITRKKEFAMLQSIGMTGKQLKSMLACEGLYYAIGTILASAFFGTLFSLIIVQGIANSIWFFTYRFVIWPMLVIYPFLLAVTIIIPSILYREIAKTSIIERLRTSA